MSDALLAWTAILLYIGLGLLVGLAARRQLGTGVSEFFLGNRQIGGFVAAMTYAATTYSAFMMLGLAGLTYKLGVGALGFELTYLGGLVLVVFFGPRFWLVGRRYSYLTHAELLADRYQNRAVGIVATLLCLIFLIPYAAIQVMGIGYLLAGVSKEAIKLFPGMLLAMILAAVWAKLAGLRSVAWTDALQAIIMLLASLTALIFLVERGFGGVAPFFRRLNSDVPELLQGPGLFSFNIFSGLALPWLFFSLSNPQVTQRLFIPKSVAAFKQMIGGFLVFGFVYTLVAVLWGFGARLLVLGLANPDQATPALLALPFIPGGIVLVVMIGILAAAVSTIDSILLTLASLCARDLYRPLAGVRASEARELRFGQGIITLLAIAFFAFAWWATGQRGLAFMIAPLSAAASAGLLMAVPTIIGAFCWQRATASGALASMVGGAVLVLVLQLSGRRPLGLWPGVWGLAFCLALFIGVSLATRPPRAKAEEFIGYLQSALRQGGFL